MSKYCGFCGVHFSPFNIRKLYCSEKCSSKVYNKNYRKHNMHKKIAYNKIYVQKNKIKVKNYFKNYNKANSIKIKEYKKKWNSKNKSFLVFKCIKRRLSKKQRTPNWLTLKQLKKIEQFYRVSYKLQKKYNIKMSVDHIVPLNGKIVSGLHVPWNLQIIPLKDNCRKSNKYE